MNAAPAVISPQKSPLPSVNDTIFPETVSSSEFFANRNSPDTILRIARHRREKRELEIAIGALMTFIASRY